MPPPKKPKNKESWEEFISESQAESSVDKLEDSLGNQKTDNQPLGGSRGIQTREPADCTIRFVKPEEPVTMIPEDLSMKPIKNSCLKTLSNTIKEMLQHAIVADGNKDTQDSSPSSEHHPQLRNFLLQPSHDCTTPDVGENLVSSAAGLQDTETTQMHSCPPRSPNFSKTLWKYPSMQASTNELQPTVAFTTSSPSGSNCEEIRKLESDGYERMRISRCKPEGDGFPLDRRNCSNNTVRNIWSRDTVYRDGGHADDLDKSWNEFYSAGQTYGLCDQDRNRLGLQVPTADSTTHMVCNNAQIKRSRVNAERFLARQQGFQPHRGQNSATERSSRELNAQGTTSADRISPGRENMESPQQTSTSEISSPDIQSHNPMHISRLFTELQRKGIPIVDYLVSLDNDLLQPRRQSGGNERILYRLFPHGFLGVSRSQRSPQSPIRGRPQTEVGFNPKKVEKGSPSGNKPNPASSCSPSDSPTKMATLQALLSDDAKPWIASETAAPSGEVNRVNTDDSCAARRLQETENVGRMENLGQWGLESCHESLENENSCEKPALTSAEVHSSPEMPSSSSCNDQGRSKADEKGVCRCQICDDVASGFHYGVWSCEGCKAFFKRSLHGPVDYVCPATNNCTIDKLRRKSCQACRLRKCHEAGMTAGTSRKEKGIRPGGKKRKAGEEEQCTSDPDTATSSSFGKFMRYNSAGSSRDVSQPPPDLSPGRETKHSPSSVPASTSNRGHDYQESPQLNALVERLLAIELPPREAEFNNSITNSSLQLLSGFLGLINSQLIDIITWSKALPDFSKSSLQSRTRLLVSSWSEMLVLGTVWQSVPQPNIWVCSPNLLLSRAHCKLVTIEPLFDRIMSLVQTFRRLQLTKVEMVLLRLTILLNSDASVIESQPPLANLRNLLDETWQQILLDDTKTSRGRLSHLLLTLPDIRQCSLMMHNVIDNARHRQGIPTYSLLHEMLDCDVLRTAEMGPTNTSVE